MSSERFDEAFILNYADRCFYNQRPMAQKLQSSFQEACFGG